MVECRLKTNLVQDERQTAEQEKGSQVSYEFVLRDNSKAHDKPVTLSVAIVGTVDEF